MLTDFPAARLVAPSFVVVFALCLGGVGFSVRDASAQEGIEAKGAADNLTKKIEEISANLIEEEQTLRQLRRQMKSKGDTVAGKVLRTELEEQQSIFRGDLGRLVDLVVKAEDEGLEDPEGRALATRLLEEDALTIREETQAASDRFFELVETIAKGTPEEAKKARSERDRTLEKSNSFFQQFHDNIEDRQKLGLDVKSDQKLISKTLEARSQIVAGFLHATREKIDEITSRAGFKTDPDAQKELAAQNGNLRVLTESQRLNVDLMDDYGLDTAGLRQGLIEDTGVLSKDVLNAEVATGLTKKWISDAGTWVRTNGASLLFSLVSFFLILLASWFAARIARGATRRGLQRSKIDMSSLAKDFFVKTAGRLVMLLGFIVAIAQLGIEVGPLLAGLGIAGFVVGFALQDTLANFASGLMILMYRPFDVGDVIEAGGVMGSVSEMNLVSTMILTPDNQRLVVPNGQIWGGIIRNVTHQDQRRVDLTFGIGYDDDIAAAEKVLAEIVESNDKVLKEPAPVIRLHELADSSVNFVVRPWAKTSDYWDVYWELTREVKRRFDEEGLSIPFPQTDVHLYSNAVRPPAAGETESAPEQFKTPSTGQTVVPDDSDD